MAVRPVSLYQKRIVDATACHPSEVHEVEEIMRHEIFHSTLDWQTREQLEAAAVEAYALFKSRQGS